ncbi:cytochrome P450 [Aspergillus venezuelensis]
MPLDPEFFLAAAVGVAVHLTAFNRGEWHLQAPWILIVHVIGFSIWSVVSPSTAAQAIAGYLVALYSSILTYRVFFHRLRHFPGPFAARTSKLWHLWKLHSGHQNHFLLADLHARYGDFVRTGPSELTVFHPSIFMAIDGPSSQCVKAEWYDLLHPHNALVTTRTKEIHGPRRQRWTRAFKPQSQRAYQKQILPLLAQLDARIQSDIETGQTTNATELCKQLWFDRMGALVLGKTFDMLLSPAHHYLISHVQRALSVLGILGPVTWLLHIAFRLMPAVWILGDWVGMINWAAGVMQRRLKLGEAGEVFNTTTLADHLFNIHDPQSHPWLTGDSILAIVAGCEPTSSAMVTLLYELARHPAHAEKIHDELTRAVANEGDEDKDEYDDKNAGQTLSRQCPHLVGAIFEALRLYPGLPTGGNRKTALNEGITVAGTWIPPETTLVAPRLSIMRRKDCFDHPDTFIPERWTTQREMVRNKAAFTPFGTGPRSCIGRTLALNDLVLVAAHLIRKYRFGFEEGDDGGAVQRDWKDQFASSPGVLRVLFEVR